MKGMNPRFLKMRGKFQDVVVTQQHNVPVVRDRVFENPTRSQSQVDWQIQFKSGSQSWKLLSEEGRRSYRELGAQMLGKTGKPMQGSNCYASITQTRALFSFPPLPMAPALLTSDPVLPSPLFLSAVNDGTFTLLIQSATQQVGLVLLECAPYVSAGVASFDKSKFRVCAVLAQIDAPQTEITAEFLDTFAVPPAGAQVAVRLTPLTETGFRGITSVFSSLVAASADEMQALVEKQQARLRYRDPLQAAA